MVMKPKGPGDARTPAFSNATLSGLSVVEKLVFTVCINFHDHSRESGANVNGTKVPLMRREAANWLRVERGTKGAVKT